MASQRRCSLTTCRSRPSRCKILLRRGILKSSPTSLIFQSKGQSKRSIQTLKALMKKAEESRSDFHVAMLNYRAIPLTDSDKSPAELLFNRHLRTKFPVPADKLVPTFARVVRPQLVDRQHNCKAVHDRHARDLPPLHPGDVVSVQQQRQLVRGEVIAQHKSPRSYVVKTERGSTIRRNRRYLMKTKEPRPDCRPPPLPTSSSPSSPSPSPMFSSPVAQQQPLLKPS